MGELHLFIFCVDAIVHLVEAFISYREKLDVPVFLLFNSWKAKHETSYWCVGEIHITHSLTHGYFSGGKSMTCNEGYSQILVFLLLNGRRILHFGKMIQSYHRILITCCKISVKVMGDSCCGGGVNERAQLRL